MENYRDLIVHIHPIIRFLSANAKENKYIIIIFFSLMLEHQKLVPLMLQLFQMGWSFHSDYEDLKHQ